LKEKEEQVMALKAELNKLKQSEVELGAYDETIVGMKRAIQERGALLLVSSYSYPNILQMH
jgi:hypothetical protein